MGSRERRLDALQRNMDTFGEQVAAHLGGDLSVLTRFREYGNDITGFITNELKATLTPPQVEVANLVACNRLVATAGCNGSGKDHLAARIALWGCYVWDALVLILGPTERQVKEIVMGEVARCFHGVPELPGTLYRSALRLGPDSHAGILGFTSNEVSRITGHHAPRLLVIVTEAQGVDNACWEGVLANVTGAESRVLAVGNPLVSSGKYYELFRPTSGWATYNISAFDCPNVIEGRDAVPGAVTLEFVEQMKREYGEGSGVYQARVLGQFPDNMDDALCARSWCQRAIKAHQGSGLVNDAAGQPMVAALDVARFGTDKSVLGFKQGGVVLEFVSWAKKDLMETCGRVQMAYEERGLSRNAVPITVDVVGVGGGVADRLKELGFTVVEFNGGKTPSDPAKYVNTRAEAFWALRRALEEGQLAIPDEPRLVDELCSMQWRPNSAGRIQIELKDDLKARLGRSPDFADCVSMLMQTRRAIPNIDPASMVVGGGSYFGGGEQERPSDGDYAREAARRLGNR